MYFHVHEFMFAYRVEVSAKGKTGLSFMLEIKEFMTNLQEFVIYLKDKK